MGSSLVLQRRKDLWSSTNGPTFSVLGMLRKGDPLGFSATKWTTQLRGQGMRNEAKNVARQISRGLIINQGETSRKRKVQAKIRSKSANVTKLLTKPTIMTF